MNYSNALNVKANPEQNAWPQGGQNAKITRQSQVQAEVERGAQLLMTLDQLIGGLRDRLEPVIRSEPPMPQDPAQDRRPMLVGHASALSNHNDQLESLNAALSKMLDLIEL